MKTILLALISLMFLGSGLAYAETYTKSAHGNTTYGVDRTSTSQYRQGHCAHCHEQHASIDGSEPSPTGGPDGYLLFNPNQTSQKINLCFDCHVDASSQQNDGYIYNRSYSYRAGGWTLDPLNNILQAFTYGPPTSTTSSSHNLNDIKTFITGKWGYTANSNPCAACHNPHAAQGDPANSANAKSSITRGYPVSLPSDHADKYVWDVYGNDAGEKMSNYVYQAPYRFDSSSAYEPDGSTTIDDGTNLTDYVTFCTDCHHYSPTPVSTRLGNTNLKDINWAESVHGGRNSWNKTDADERKPPYNNPEEKNYVLACTDCHEPHGSPNYCYKIRKEVNGGLTAVNGNTNADWDTLCSRCHTTTHEAESCVFCHFHGEFRDPPDFDPLF